MKKHMIATAVGLFALAPSLASGQVVSSLAGIHSFMEQAITATAELVQEDLYSFQPTEEVRTLGRILAHVANSNFQMCLLRRICGSLPSNLRGSDALVF